MVSNKIKVVPDTGRLDRLVAEARRAGELREQGYRAQALKLYPHVCGRCARTFAGATLRELTVHHKDGNHDNNTPDGGNWELLCIYCHENEHARILDQSGAAAAGKTGTSATHRPFAALDALLKKKADK